MVKITDLFKEEEMTEKADGNIKVKCPSCDGSSYGGMVLFPETNTAFCHNSQKWFTMKEVFALQKGIIKCIEGREKKNE